MTATKQLQDRLLELSDLYKQQWQKACEFEGAKETAIAVEFSEGNIHAIACVEIMKEIKSINNTLKSGMIKENE